MASSCRTVLVGCGGMGRQHLKIIRGMPDFEIAGICDVFDEAIADAGDAFGVSGRYSDFERMYDETRPDLVVVATQTRGHRAPPWRRCGAGYPFSAKSRSPSIPPRRMRWLRRLTHRARSWPSTSRAT